jgi:metal-responsive CopG/Arc/MetJ family transcriptional regulator
MTTSQPKTLTAFQMNEELGKDLDRYATINTEGNRSWAIRKLLRQALATERQQAA